MRGAQQIYRFDGKNVFLELMNSMFDKDRLVMNFIEYDEAQASGNRQKNNLPFFIEFSDALILCNDILSGKLSKKGQDAQKNAKEKGYKYAPFIYQSLGGTSAERLAKMGKSRPDGKALSRQFKITPGEKFPWILSCEHGPGKEDESGLISPDGKAEGFVRIPLTDDDFKKFAILIQTHINNYITSTYVTGEALASYQDANVMADYYVKKAERMPISHNIQKAKQSLYDVEDKTLKDALNKRIDALTK